MINLEIEKVLDRLPLADVRLIRSIDKKHFSASAASRFLYTYSSFSGVVKINIKCVS